MNPRKQIKKSRGMNSGKSKSLVGKSLSPTLSELLFSSRTLSVRYLSFVFRSRFCSRSERRNLRFFFFFCVYLFLFFNFYLRPLGLRVQSWRRSRVVKLLKIRKCPSERGVYVRRNNVEKLA